jgi:hypothetical protein
LGAGQPSGTPFSLAKDGVRVALRVSPGASRNRIEGIAPDAGGKAVLKIAVTAPPEGGKANQAVIALLAKAWRQPKRSFSFTAGAGARRKMLHVAGDGKELMRRIADRS